MAPPPTLVLDAVHLGWAGLLVLPNFVTAAVFAGRAVRRRGRGRKLAIAAGVAVFVALDLVAYFVGLELMFAARREQREQRERRSGEVREPGRARQAPEDRSFGTAAQSTHSARNTSVSPWVLAPRLEANTRCLPSRVNIGKPSKVSLKVTCSWFWPSSPIR
ncbi:hypothetical protein SAMN02745121_01383 [Nannocystis exedens]|uniref:Uncharacterized protein n=1 Tax=Nannocystis exedens TaxID=54 RepID=A0A1I1UXE8_9BACT|nr:hypothetical protein NAEX_05253 [Nannocystis exedens]SFD75481.1 hypothetical protein SAMN02745121_01383 [Nannocystis exedens]